MRNPKKKSNSGSGAGDDSNSTRISTYPKGIELERTVDELMISQFQLEKLRSRLAGKFVRYVHKADVYYASIQSKQLLSSFEIRHKDKAYRVTIEIKKSDMASNEYDGST